MTRHDPVLIFRLAEGAHWARALEEGVYRGAAVDARDGYLHFSAADQLAETARRHYRGRSGLVLLAVRPRDLGSALVWEVSRGGDLFPHLYAPLRVGDVFWARSARLGAFGAPQTMALL